MLVGVRQQLGGPSVLILFAGPPERADSLAAFMRSLGIRAVCIDTKAGGVAHDVTRPEVAARLMGRVQAGEFAVVFAAPPCQSYSVAHRPRLRSAEHPEGLPVVPDEWRRYVAKHNALTAFTFGLLGAAEAAGAMVLVENPAARGGPPIGDPRAVWRRHREHGSIWHTAAARRTRRASFTFAQCAFRAPVQKWTTIGASEAIAPFLEGLRRRGCDHAGQRHEHTAHGRDEDGRAYAEQAAAYPMEMNAFLAAAIAIAVAHRRCHGAACETCSEQSESSQGGRVRDGAALSPTMREAVAAARQAPTRFASTLHRVPAGREELLAAPMPGDFHRAMLSSKPRKGKLKRGRELGTDNSAAALMSGARSSSRPAGSIEIEQLFLPGVYTGVVDAWLRGAAEAVRMMRAGSRVPKMETCVLPQEALQPWARGIVWDTRDRHDCRPMPRSTRDTVFPGQRQLDRGALREVAAQLDWHDTDILDQVGEGGIETRSSCPLTTVLAWHHRGIEQHWEVADGVIRTEMQDGWVSQPHAHLPTVPCRLLPRNVVRQQRTRLRDGKLEHYLKPRITQDSSDGAEASVNHGVPAAETSVELPTVQQLGRGAAIVHEAGAGAPSGEETSAELYIVDATAAFRFCVMQQAEWWTQAFLWWDEHGSIGVCIDTRMAFGGRYSPNRFERVARLVGAHIQGMQARFDAEQPPPPHVRGWQQRRTQMQQEGLLPHEAAHAAPRYLQVFIDDWAGAALNDPVRPPPHLAPFDIAPAATVAAGGKPAAANSRVRVHAQLALAGMHRVGLEAVASKSLVGDPIVGLGIRVHVRGWRMDVPSDKQAAIIEEIDAARAAARDGAPCVDIERGMRLVGRMCNLSQVAPEVVAYMHGGYAVTSGPWAARAAGAPKGTMTLRKHSRAWHGWIAFLNVARLAVDQNRGVALASRLIFPPLEAAGSATSITDASGWDGVGGYVFCADAPKHVWIVSEAWPEDVRAALAKAALPKAERAAAAAPAELAVAAAEIFGAWAVPRAAAQSGARWCRVVSIVDCMPAAHALGSTTSTNAVMRAICSETRGLTDEWIACAVPREHNLDGDRLSHPSQCGEVMADAEAAGLQVHRAHIDDEAWDTLREAMGMLRLRGSGDRGSSSNRDGTRDWAECDVCGKRRAGAPCPSCGTCGVCGTRGYASTPCDVCFDIIDPDDGAYHFIDGTRMGWREGPRPPPTRQEVETPPEASPPADGGAPDAAPPAGGASRPERTEAQRAAEDLAEATDHRARLIAQHIRSRTAVVRVGRGGTRSEMHGSLRTALTAARVDAGSMETRRELARAHDASW